MGVGHVAIAFAGKHFAPKVSLGWLIFATLFVDVLWAATVGFGIEHVRIEKGFLPASPFDLYDYPWTHSLVGSLGWSVGFAALAWLVLRDVRGALVLGLAVLSHWVLDLIAHKPDLPVLPSGPYLGLGLWYSLWGTILVEALMVAGAAWVYLKETRASDRLGHWGLIGLLGFLLVMHLAVYLGPPPTVAMIPWSGLTLLLPMVFAHVVDRHRTAVAAA